MSRSKRQFSPSVFALEGRALLSTFTVLNNNDSGADSLRADIALANASPGSTVNFAPSVTGTISLTSGEISITAPVTINGPGAGTLAIDGGGLSRIFDISGAPSPPSPVSISGLAFEHGSASSSTFTPLAGGDGGAIQSDNSVVVLHNDAFIGNFATNRGGAVFNFDGMLTVDSCAFSANTTNFHGGAIYNSGKEVVPAAASLGVINSIFTGNHAGEGGGAIENAEADATLFGLRTIAADIQTSTFTNNGSDKYGGAISDDNGGILTTIGSTFTSNSTPGDGGAIASGKVGPLGKVSDVGSKFITNAVGDHGGAIFSDTPLSLTGTLAEFDTSALALLAGGGVHAKMATYTHSGETILFNTPDNVVLV